MSHSHSEPLRHSHSHGHSHGHGHSHDTSPYSRSCQSPTTASSYSFICAFLGSLSAISLPTHITGYFLPTLLQTILLWSVVALGVTYAGLTASLFFKILEEAVSDRYGVPLFVEWETRDKDLKALRDGRDKKLGVRGVRGISWAALTTLLLLIATSIGLFVLGFGRDDAEWLEFCTTEALLVSDPSSFDSSHGSTARSDNVADTSKLELCHSMALNQSYLVLGVPIILLTVEIVRHFKTLAFVDLAFDQEIREKAPRIDLGRGSEVGDVNGTIREARELARGRRRRAKLARMRSLSDSDDSEKDRLLSV
ncbi:hypothetical protein JCM11491_004466 [Sporobolomyces phaffii]